LAPSEGGALAATQAATSLQDNWTDTERCFRILNLASAPVGGGRHYFWTFTGSAALSLGTAPLFWICYGPFPFLLIGHWQCLASASLLLLFFAHTFLGPEFGATFELWHLVGHCYPFVCTLASALLLAEA
jgi:hypothetical protein